MANIRYTILYFNHIVRYIIVLVIPIIMYTVSNIIILHNNIICRYLYIIIIYKITRIRMTKRFPLYFKRNPILWFRKCIFFFFYLGLIAVTDTADQNWVDEKKKLLQLNFLCTKSLSNPSDFGLRVLNIFIRNIYFYAHAHTHTYIHTNIQSPQSDETV
jgi:hypothetical protein